MHCCLVCVKKISFKKITIFIKAHLRRNSFSTENYLHWVSEANKKQVLYYISRMKYQWATDSGTTIESFPDFWLNFFDGFHWYLGLAFAFNEWKMVSFGYNHVYVASSHVPVCSSEVD